MRNEIVVLAIIQNLSFTKVSFEPVEEVAQGTPQVYDRGEIYHQLNIEIYIYI